MFRIISVVDFRVQAISEASDAPYELVPFCLISELLSQPENIYIYGANTDRMIATPYCIQ